MQTKVKIIVDGTACIVPRASSVASALLSQGFWQFRSSVAGEPRSPVCGMGICFECRVTIDGQPNMKSCLIDVTDGMKIQTA